MIDLHSWPTPNGQKISVALEELALPYTLIPVDIGRGAQFAPEFLAISPNNRIPAIVDHAPAGGGAPIAVFESGAILLYLADKTGRLVPADLRGRTECVQWLMWQIGGLGPMLGQANYFAHYASERLPHAIERYVGESTRLLGVMNKRLADREFLAGPYSIADIACFTWVRSARERIEVAWDAMPHVVRWLDAVGARPAVARGLAVGVESVRQGLDDEARKHLFGK